MNESFFYLYIGRIKSISTYDYTVIFIQPIRSIVCILNSKLEFFKLRFKYKKEHLSEKRIVQCKFDCWLITHVVVEQEKGNYIYYSN
jgi:hypothetical protein